MPRIGIVNNTSNLVLSCSLGEAWVASQLGEIFSGDSKVLIEEGFHDLFRGYYKRLGSDPSIVTAKEASEFLESLGVTLA